MALNCLANLVHKTGSLYATSHDKMYEILNLNLITSPQYESGPMATLSSTVRRKDRASERKVSTQSNGTELVIETLRRLTYFSPYLVFLDSWSAPPFAHCTFCYRRTNNSPSGQ